MTPNFELSDESVAMVDMYMGIVKALKPGTSTITAVAYFYSSDDKAPLEVTCEIIVENEKQSINTTWIIIIIVASCVLVCAGVCVVIIAIKRKSKN